MGNRLGWIVFAGTIATVLGGYLVFTMWPHPRETYCTAGFGSCITNRRGEWHVLDTPCPAGQSPRFTSLAAHRCHSIRPPGFPVPLSVCPIKC